MAGQHPVRSSTSTRRGHREGHRGMARSPPPRGAVRSDRARYSGQSGHRAGGAAAVSASDDGCGAGRSCASASAARSGRNTAPTAHPVRTGPGPRARTQRRRRGAITDRRGRPPAPARARITKGAGRSGAQRGAPARARWPPEAAGTPAPAPWKGQRHEIRRTRLARAARSRPHPVEVQLRACGRCGLASRRRLLLPGAALVLPAPREWRPP